MKSKQKPIYDKQEGAGRKELDSSYSRREVIARRPPAAEAAAAHPIKLRVRIDWFVLRLHGESEERGI